jgi:hypothetical protein
MVRLSHMVRERLGSLGRSFNSIQGKAYPSFSHTTEQVRAALVKASLLATSKQKVMIASFAAPRRFIVAQVFTLQSFYVVCER